MGTKETLLTLLESKRGEAVSGEEVAATLGLSRAAVWKAVKALRGEGLAVESVPGVGYRLASEIDIISDEVLDRYVKAAAGDFPTRYLPQVDSTNLEAKRWALEGAAHGSLVLAERQDMGRGRLGRSFASPPGGMYISVVLRPRAGGGVPVLTTAAAAVAACRATQKLCGLSLGIKWVNDLYVGGKKCCGILTEAGTGVEMGEIEYMVVGIGINYTTPQDAFPKEIRDVATSLFPGGPAPVPRAQLAAGIHAELLKLFDKLPGKTFLPEYKKRSIVLGRPVTVMATPPWQGFAVDIDDEARLLVRTEGGEVIPLSFGEISVKL